MATTSRTGAAAPASTLFNFVNAAHLLHPQRCSGASAPAQAQERYHQLRGHIDNLTNVADDMAHMSDGIDLLLAALEASARAMSLDDSTASALRGLFGPISQQLRTHAATLAVAVTDPSAL